ncbi:hypothetical protein [Kribbella qitaiheensis]|nr:hypothetical protein [Kribbella qitaiheensis]
MSRFREATSFIASNASGRAISMRSPARLAFLALDVECGGIHGVA